MQKSSTPKTKATLPARPRGRWHRPLGLQPTAEQIARHAAETLAFWTPEQRAAAQPIRLPGSEGGQGDASPAPQTDFTTSKVGNVTVPPYSSIGKIFLTLNGRIARGSGVLIGPSLLLTAGHAVYDTRAKVYAKKLTFYPEYNDGVTQSGLSYLDYYVPDAWLEDGDYAYDYAFVRLTQSSSLRYLWLAGSVPDPGDAVTAVGYPGEAIPGYDFNGNYQWQSVSTISILSTGQLRMGNNMTEGCSGGPWLNTQNQIIGVNSSSPFGNTIMASPTLGPAALALYAEAAGLAPEWVFDLNHSGHNSVSIAMTNGLTVLGSDGWIYLLANDGFFWDSNGLSGLGHNDVQLALKVEDTGELITFAGTDGYVVAIREGDFKGEKWRTKLPNTSGTKVNVLWDETHLFAGCAGHVYWLDPDTGAVLARNDLSVIGSEEIRLSSTPTTLFVGSDEYVIAIDLSSRESFTNTIWATELDDADDIVSVLAVGSSVYAGTYGVVYQLDQATGSLQYTNRMSGLGNDEVRFVSDGTNLYVGTYGYLLGMSLGNITTSLWQQPLAHSGRELVNVAVTGGNVFAGCDGYAYQYDTAGTLLSSNGLKGYGYHEVSVATDGFVVTIGTNGWAIGTTVTNFPGAVNSPSAGALEPA